MRPLIPIMRLLFGLLLCKDSARRIFVQAEFSCKPKAIANLFDIAEVQPKMGEAKDSANEGRTIKLV